MTQHFTKRTSRNSFQRLGDSLAGTMIGVVLLLVSIGLLTWNEGRAINAIRGLDAGERSAVSLPASNVAPTNEGRLIHVTGTTSSATPVLDPLTGVSVDNALILARRVEMFQWVETASTSTREKIGGTQETVTTYRYARNWSPDPIASVTFAHKTPERTNPPMNITSARLSAAAAAVGAFSLDTKALDRLSPEAPVVLAAAPSGWRLINGGLYRGAGTPEAPRIGDLRVSYTQVAAGAALSVMGRQTGTSITTWSNNAQGYDLLMAEPGTKSVADMIKTKKAGETVLTWVLRVFGFGLCWAGFGLILGPLSALGNVIPLVASILGTATGMVAFGLGTGISLTVIALAWFAFRPLVSAGLIAAGIAIWSFTRGRQAAKSSSAKTT
jgi:hypothetical protein